MAFPDEAKRYFKEEDAEFVSITRLPIPRVRELTRKWHKINNDYVEEVVRAIELYTSAGNASRGRIARGAAWPQTASCRASVISMGSGNSVAPA